MSVTPPQYLAEDSGTTPHVQEVIRTAERELNELLQQRSEIMRRVGTIRQLLNGMVSLFGETILDQELMTALDRGVSGRRSGFTRACRTVLMESGRPMRTRDACEQLGRRFPELVERHKDLSASVTTIFHRLTRYSEARCYLDSERVRVWEWIRDPHAGTAIETTAAPRDAVEASEACS
jgi:chorismate mutase